MKDVIDFQDVKKGSEHQSLITRNERAVVTNTLEQEMGEKGEKEEEMINIHGKKCSRNEVM